ncbi:hypothetical protein EVAR_98835_1 [Eumeta japonica]|uniref:Uncharacterized protein n=1 Tax=Eumeta variegata TaxID=151549 RepID=A0A4C1YLI9_EUMVA|nr:hypothetical protein EVAR_98835_1 [Eumeta japonica]
MAHLSNILFLSRRISGILCPPSDVLFQKASKLPATASGLRSDDLKFCKRFENRWLGTTELVWLWYREEETGSDHVARYNDDGRTLKSVAWPGAKGPRARGHPRTKWAGDMTAVADEMADGIAKDKAKLNSSEEASTPRESMKQ